MSNIYLNRLLDTCLQHDADELRLVAGKPPILCIGSERVELKSGPITSEAVRRFMNTVTFGCAASESPSANEPVYHFDYDDGKRANSAVRFRVSVFPQHDEIAFAPQRITES